jgi:hypothetical protein
MSGKGGLSQNEYESDEIPESGSDSGRFQMILTSLVSGTGPHCNNRDSHGDKASHERTW